MDRADLLLHLESHKGLLIDGYVQKGNFETVDGLAYVHGHLDLNALLAFVQSAKTRSGGTDASP